MSNRVIKLIEIKKKLTMVPGHKLDEVADFLGFILSRHKGEGKKNIRMQGIWAGKGFERLDIGKETKSVSKDPSKSILKKGKLAVNKIHPQNKSQEVKGDIQNMRRLG